MAQLHGKLQISTDHPAMEAMAITPSDADDVWARALYIGTAGDVAIQCYDNAASVVFKSCPVGVLPVTAKRVFATGTTATNILGLY